MMSELKRSLAVVIGVNQYTNGIPTLKTAVNDATKFAQILEEKYHYKVLQLLDTDATYEKLTQLFAAFEQQKIPFPEGLFPIESNDRVLFYFAGHGIAEDGIDNADGPTGFLVPQNALLDNRNTWLLMNQLHDALLKLPCRHLLVILDCCFAGSFRWAGHSRHAVRSQKVYRERYERFVSGCAQEVITSAAHDEKAADSLYRFGQRGEHEGHSPFAELLLKALSGAADFTTDGVVTATELYLYLFTELGKTVTKQTPGIFQLKRHDKGQYFFPIPGFNPKRLEEAPKLSEKLNPYRGLESFEEEDSELFFGRKALIDKLKTFVLSHQLTVVLGASGSGKSSLVKAGLIPCLKTLTPAQNESQTQLRSNVPITATSSPLQWITLPAVRPGEAPFVALNSVLPKESAATVPIEKGAYEQAVNILLNNLSYWMNQNPQSKLLIVIDQAEELFTLCPNDLERQQFLRLLAEALAAHPQQLHILLTLRSDFEPQFRDKALERYWTAARFIIPAMTREELREAITEPATLRVLYFDPPSLVDQLIDEVMQMPGALPLLSFTLSELYLKYIKSSREGERSERAITQQDYEQLGGVTRSLTQRADWEYDELIKLDSAYEKTIRHVMLRMVAIGTGELARIRVLRTELEYPEPQNGRVEEVIRRFSAARLLVGGRDTEGNLYVEPAHDALVRGWQKLLVWKQQEQEELILQRRLTPAAEEWQKQREKQTLNTADQPLNKIKVKFVRLQQQQTSAEEQKYQKASQFLWADDPRLPLLEKVQKSSDSWLNSVESEFVESSIKQRQKKLSRLIGAIAIFVGVIITAAVVSNLLRLEAERQRQEAELREKAALAVNLSPIKPVEGLVRAVQATGQSLANLKQVIVPVQSSLLSAIDIPREREVFKDHHESVTAVAVSQNAQLIASGSRDGKLGLWNTQNNHLIKLWQAHTGEVTSVAISQNSQMIVSSSADGTVRLWNTQGNPVSNPFEGHQGRVLSVAISQDSQLIVSGGEDGTMRLWDFQNRRIVQTQPLKDQNDQVVPVNSVAISQDKQLIVSGSRDGKIGLWNTKNNQPIKLWQAHRGSVTSVAMSANSRRIISGSNDRTLRLWDSQGKAIGESFRGHEDAVTSVAFSPNGQSVVSGSQDNSMRLWDLKGNLLGYAFQGHESWIRSVAFAPNGQFLVSGSNDETLRIWDLQPSHRISLPFRDRQEVYQGKVWKVDISPDHQYIVSGSYDGTVRLWDQQGQLIGKPFNGNGGTVFSVAFSPNGQLIASGSEDGMVRFSDRQGNLIASSKIRHQGTVYSVAFSPDGQLIVSGSADGKVGLWDLKGNPLINPFQAHTSYINAIAFSPVSKSSRKEIGQFIASGGGDGDDTVRLWDLKGNKKGEFPGHQLSVESLAWSHDGKFIASGSADNTLRLWDVQTGKQKGLPFRGHKGWVSSIAFSLDNQFIVTGSWDNTLRLWNIEGDPLGSPFRGHKNWISSAVFSPDGQTILSGSADKTVRVWRAGTWEDWLETACQQLRDHPILKEPENEAQSAKETCQKYVWKKR